MFNRPLEEFINEKKSKMFEEKERLFQKLNQNIDKNGYGKQEYNISNDKENTISKENDDKMLKHGEFSPNNPKMRVATQPYLGLGEYEQRRQLLLQERKADYKHHINQVHSNENRFTVRQPTSNRDKAVQTDIQNIQTQLVMSAPTSQIQGNVPSKISVNHGKNISNTNITRAKLMADLQSSYFPTFPNNTHYSQDDERIEKVRRQEKYLNELRQQIEEKKLLQQKHRQQDKIEQESVTNKLNRFQINDQPLDNKIYIGNNINSPPLTRRKQINDPNKPYSFNIPSNSVFATQNQILKKASPISKDLIHSQPVTSSKIDQMKNLEAKWQIPAMQKNVENKKDGILTQLGAIRLQLQQEQLRLNETLKTRGLVETKADVHQF